MRVVEKMKPLIHLRLFHDYLDQLLFNVKMHHKRIFSWNPFVDPAAHARAHVGEAALEHYLGAGMEFILRFCVHLPFH